MAYVPGDTWSEEVKKEIVARLNAKRVGSKCPMCGHSQFALGEGYLTQPVQSSLQAFAVGGAAIPTVALICTNCGFISQHALGVLGLLDTSTMGGPR
jgi:hypothetical protein